MGAAEKLTGLRLLHGTGQRPSGKRSRLAHRQNGHPRQEAAGHAGCHPLHDPVLVQVPVLAGGVPQQDLRLSRLSGRPGHPDPGLAGLRPGGHRALHVAALLRLFLHPCAVGPTLHQLRAGGDGRDLRRVQAPDPQVHHHPPGAAQCAVRRGHDPVQVHRHLRRGGKPGQPHRLLHAGHQDEELHQRQPPAWPPSSSLPTSASSAFAKATPPSAARAGAVPKCASARPRFL